LSFWCASKLLREQANPYSISAFGACIGSVHPSVADPLVWLPPWSFAVVAPFSLLNFDAFSRLWLILNALAFSGSAVICVNLFGDRGSVRALGVWPWLFLLSFGPMYLALVLGQLTGVLLLCVCVFLWLYRGDFGVGRALTAGGVLSPLMMKPHLVYLLFVLVVWREVRRRRAAVLGGLGAGFAMLCLVPLTMQREIYLHYLSRETVVPTFWRTASVASVLGAVVSFRWPLVAFLPAAVAAVGMAVLVCRDDGWLDVDRAVGVGILVSIVSAPYVWPYDFGLLLPVVVCVLARAGNADGRTRGPSGLRVVTGGVLVGANVAFLWFRGDMFFDVWYPWAIGAVALPWLVVDRRTRGGSRGAG